MRILFCGLVAAALAFSSAPPAGQAPPSGGVSLTGRVVTGAGPDARPVRRARVTLLGRGLSGPRITDTDTRGAYRFDRLPAGAYMVTVQKPGFVKLEADAAPDGTLTMERGGAIEGIVTDAAGDPVSNVSMSALQPQPDGARPKLIAASRTDDLGRYRIHSLAAGDYFVEAATDRVGIIDSIVLMAGEKPPDVNRGYYPSGLGVEDARAVRLSAGRDSTSIDLTFTPSPPIVDPAAPPPAPRAEPTGTARVAGRIVDGVSGKPIRNARLLLLPLEGVALTNWRRTDAQGRFEYTNLAARRYKLSVAADRFVQLEFGQLRPGESGTPIQVAEGQDFRADMKLPRTSALEGSLLDEFGDPAPGVVVQVARKQFAAGRHRLVPAGGRTQVVADDRGRFRVTALDPGDYYVAGLSGAFTDQNEVGGFAPTYYPGTTDSGAAVPVTVTFGADTSGTTFALSPARTLSISGTMVDAAGKPVEGRGTVWLAPPDRLKRMEFNLARGVTSPDGRFVLRNVPQGTYTMQGFGGPPPGGRGPGNLGAMPFGWLPVTVGDSDLDGLVLKVTTGAFLRGKIVLEDTGATPPKAGEVRVTAIPAEFDSAPVGGGPPPSQTREDWTFEVTNLSGMRRIFVNVAAPAWALKKITLDGLDVTDSPVDFRTKDVDDVEVLLTPKVSRVSGAVSDDKGPVSDYAVVIFAADPTKWIDRSRFVVMARPAQQRAFQARGLPPEQYLAVALPRVVQSEWMDPDFLHQLRPLATSFVLQEGESKTLELKLKQRP